MRPQTEALLYAASRIQHLEEKNIASSCRGEGSACDRFLDSSVAYQGYGRCLGAEYVRNINAYALQHAPQQTLFSGYTGAGAGTQSQAERQQIGWSRKPFFERVCQGYEEICAAGTAACNGH